MKIDLIIDEEDIHACISSEVEDEIRRLVDREVRSNKKVMKVLKECKGIPIKIDRQSIEKAVRDEIRRCIEDLTNEDAFKQEIWSKVRELVEI